MHAEALSGGMVMYGYEIDEIVWAWVETASNLKPDWLAIFMHISVVPTLH